MLRVSVQRATPLLHKECRHIEAVQCNGSFCNAKVYIHSIYKMESVIRLSRRTQCITHKVSVRHHKPLHFWRCGPASYLHTPTFIQVLYWKYKVQNSLSVFCPVYILNRRWRLRMISGLTSLWVMILLR